MKYVLVDLFFNDLGILTKFILNFIKLTLEELF
jgi:hypothetical protein